MKKPNLLNILKESTKKTIRAIVYFLPALLLKIRTGISYKESKSIAHFYFYTALYHKQFFHAWKVFILLFFKTPWNDPLPDFSFLNPKQNEPKQAAWRIGQWYSLAPQSPSETAAKADTQNTKYFSIGREAITHILKQNHFTKKVALLPIFTCFTVLDPFLQDNWEICFYRYNRDLTIDTEYFVEVFQKQKPSICIFQPLSGMGFLDSENHLIDYAYQNGCLTVIDQTQDVYNDRNNPSVDYYCGSLRKWYPFPDGAFLYSNRHIISNCQQLEENNIYRTAMGLCMYAQHLKSVYTDPFFAYLYGFMWSFSVSYIGATVITPHTMSEYSRRILSRQDELFHMERRKSNFLRIYQGINGLKNIKPAFDNIERLVSVPLSFPVYVNNRRSFVQYLRSKGIITQLLWSKPPYISKIPLDENTEYIYDHILSLPCDSRYSEDDMQCMIDIIRDYDCTCNHNNC